MTVDGDSSQERRYQPASTPSASAAPALSSAPALKDSNAELDVAKLRDQVIVLLTSWRAIAAVIMAIAAIVGITYSVIKYVEVTPLQLENAHLKSDLESSKNHFSQIEARLAQADSNARQIAASNVLPITTEPAAGASVIGNQLRLRWYYPKQHSPESYVVEVINVNLSNARVTTHSWQVPSPERHELNIRDFADMVGLNFWRVRPGIVGSISSPDDGWSRYSDFSLYLSTGDRITLTKHLLIGTHTLSYPTSFNCRNAQGNRDGFDIELIKWVSTRLALDPEFVDLEWTDLIPAVKRHDVDIACGSLTASKKRETDFNVRFSAGYLDTHQAFYSSKPVTQGFPANLKGAVVAVAPGSTNKDVAVYLSHKFGFTVKDDYPNYSQIYSDLDNGIVTFALFDSTLEASLAGGKYTQYGPLLDEYLTEFHRREFGRDSEQYAFVLSSEAADDGYLDKINAILSTPEARAYIETLKHKWLTAGASCPGVVD